jgi:hypothetical protein
MSDDPERPGDKQPEPIKHADAETLSDADSEASRAGENAREEFEDDPARNPDDEQLQDIKGG